VNAVDRVERATAPWYTLRRGAFVVPPNIRPGQVILLADPAADVQFIPAMEVPWFVAWAIVEDNAC
jgi:hypothetical protein